jgi:hypothetical protein
MGGFKRNLPPVQVPANAVSGMKATFIPYGDKHQWKQLGVVVIHDAKTEISLNEFDLRYRGKKSRLGRYLRDLHAKGVDITSVLSTLEPLEKEKEELALTLTKRLYEALGKRTAYKRVPCFKCGVKEATIVKKEEAWDWKHPGVKHSKYYKMVVRILNENDQETAIRIINTITGYA